MADKSSKPPKRSWTRNCPPMPFERCRATLKQRTASNPRGKVTASSAGEGRTVEQVPSGRTVCSDGSGLLVLPDGRVLVSWAEGGLVRMVEMGHRGEQDTSTVDLGTIDV